MAGTFSQIYIQYVFVVQGRMNMILPVFQDEVYKYISGIVTAKGQKTLAVNGMEDHVHVLVGLKPAMRIADLVRDIKNNSSNFINEKGYLKQKFCWQEGYGAFSYSQANFGSVIEYIKNQKEHHKKRTFKTEYMVFLRKFNIAFEDKYLFEFYN
jgi:REP element-mobilizing transposase RayT